MCCDEASGTSASDFVSEMPRFDPVPSSPVFDRRELFFCLMLGELVLSQAVDVEYRIVFCT